MKEKNYFEILEEIEKQKHSEYTLQLELGEKCLNAIKSLEKVKKIISVNHLIRFNGKDYNISISEWKGVKDGTCELCYGTAWVENGSITVEDENGNETEINLTEWEWGDYFTIYIDNVVNFSAWLQERDVEPIGEETEPWSWLCELVEKYNKGQEDER